MPGVRARPMRAAAQSATLGPACSSGDPFTCDTVDIDMNAIDAAPSMLASAVQQRRQQVCATPPLAPLEVAARGVGRRCQRVGGRGRATIITPAVMQLVLVPSK